MNKRIQDLKALATRPRGPNKDPEFDEDYFAELIVKECAKVAMDTSRDPYDQILKHFGVE